MGGKERAPDGAFDLENPVLPPEVDEAALGSGGYPYDDKLDRKDYDRTIVPLQIELIRLLEWLGAARRRLVVVFEGRDAAGKGGAIATVRENLNPRYARIVALSKPSDVESGQWYFQRYSAQLPTEGEIVLFDRSWYNRGVVEPVMGFCSPDETTAFLNDAPLFENLIVRSGTYLVKIWLDIGREMQLKRFHDRRHDPLKRWKISPVDVEAIGRWDAFSQARDRMIAATHTPHAPWTVIRANDKRRARIETIRHVLLAVPYEGRDEAAIGRPDPKIVGDGPKHLLPGGGARAGRGRR